MAQAISAAALAGYYQPHMAPDTDDERFMRISIERMKDDKHLRLAVARLSGTSWFPGLILQIAKADAAALPTLRRRMMWEIEGEVMSQVRREVFGHGD